MKMNRDSPHKYAVKVIAAIKDLVMIYVSAKAMKPLMKAAS